MSREQQTVMQFASWIAKDRWDPLLKWFNQNDSDGAFWKTLFDQAQAHDIQTKWSRYIDFFEKHLEHKSCKNVSFIDRSDAQRRSWKVLNVAFTNFFAKAAPLLAPVQRAELRGKVMQWMTPWLYEKERVPSSDAKNCFVTAFSILTSLDALDEWDSIKHLMHCSYISSMLKHTVQKESQWVLGLRELYVADGKSLSSWRVMLFKADCIEHLSVEGTAFPVVHALLDYSEQDDKTQRVDIAVLAAFRRFPYFCVWVERAFGEDAQACRAVLGLPEIDMPRSSMATMLDIGRNLGLSVNDLSCLLDTVTVKLDDMLVDVRVFEESVLNNLVIQT